MGVSKALVDAHVEYWEDYLSKTNRPHRREWPPRLFRHEPIENAVAVLRSGRLLSRNDAAGLIVRDIAPGQIIANRQFAQNYVRLYFRPRTPTQYRVEGIRKVADYYEGKHAPVLIIFVFKCEDLLTRDGVVFSDGNMQSGATRWGSDDNFFSGIDFQTVFHEGAFNPGDPANHDITRQRCAEVMLPSPLELEPVLNAVLCRSHAERKTLLHLLGDESERWRNKIVVHTSTGLFNNEHVYLDKFNLNNAGFDFQFHPPFRYQNYRVRVSVRNIETGEHANFGVWELDPRTRWKYEHAFEDGNYEVIFEIEDCVAFHAILQVDSLPF